LKACACAPWISSSFPGTEHWLPNPGSGSTGPWRWMNRNPGRTS